MSICFEDEGNTGYTLDLNTIAMQYWYAFIGDTPNYADMIYSQICMTAAKNALKLEKEALMWTYIDKAVYHAVRFDENPSYDGDALKFLEGTGISMYTSSLNNACHGVLKDLRNHFNRYSHDQRYAEYCNRLEASKKSKEDANIW